MRDISYFLNNLKPVKQLELSTNISFLIEEKLTREILSFLSLFVSSIIIANILGRLFKQILGLIFLGQVDKLLGGFFGLFKSILILKIVIILISNLPVQNQLVDSANNSYVEKNINFDGNYFFTSFKNLLPGEIDDQ